MFAKCACSKCGGHLEFESSNDGEHVACPHCGTQTQLYIPKSHGMQKEAPDYPQKPQRVTLTKTQCATPAGQELINFLSEVEHDGLVTEEGFLRLERWLSGKADPDIPAIDFLSRLTSERLTTGKFTTEDAFEVQLAIERVLPKDIRTQIIAKRREAWPQSPASENQIQYIRNLGGSPRTGMTRAEASALIDQLLPPATEKQISYIRDLGGSATEGLTKSAASHLIDELLVENQPTPAAQPGPNQVPTRQPTPRQLMVLRFWNRLDLATKDRAEVSAWMDQFYSESAPRELAWKYFKLDSCDDGSQSDPSRVSIGAGYVYLQKMKRNRQVMVASLFAVLIGIALLVWVVAR